MTPILAIKTSFIAIQAEYDHLKEKEKEKKIPTCLHLASIVQCFIHRGGEDLEHP